MRRALLRICIACAFGFGSCAAAAPMVQASSCSFMLGFKTLHDLIPTIVGNCIDNEAHNPTNGDAVQHSVNGLLVWRKADNDTAFTDGYRTWVNGPYGVEERLNSQRFSWEANPDGLPLADAGPLQRCHTGQLSVANTSSQGAAGHIGLTFSVRSMAPQDCSLYGFFGAQMLNAQRQPLPTSLTWTTTGYTFGTVPEVQVVLAPGATAFFAMDYSDVPRTGDTCPTSSYLELTPPDEYTPLTLSAQITPCGGRINESPVLAGSAGLP